MARSPAEKKIGSAAMEKLNRVRRMSVREALYRLGEKLRMEFDRARALGPEARARAARARLTGTSFLDYLHQGPSERFYFSPAARLRIFRRIAADYPAWIDAAASEADRLLRHKVRILGFGEIDLGPEIDWHRDPVTGRAWPRKFWTDYDPVRQCEHGDAKIVHELNRHAHLPRLAKAYFLTGEEEYAAEAVAQLRSWIRQNPPSFGINWHSSLEIALRCTAWIWTLFFLLPSRSLDQDAARLIGESLFAQLEHVFRYPSIYSSPNTHLIGEASTLFLAGTLFSEHRRARRWRRRGAALLLEQAKEQVTADGVHVELSTCYHCYTVDFFVQALALSRRNCVELPEPMWTTVARMVEFLAHASLPDGTVPPLGDDDGGRALTVTADSYRSYPEAFCSAAVLFGRPDFKYLGGPFREETFWLLGEGSAELYETLAAHAPSVLSAGYPSAGYFVERSDWGRKADHLIFDCGGLGRPSGGHGHADALSLTVACRGREALVDPGTYVYNGAPQWRDHFRSTRAHNTVTVDGVSQSEPGATFQWRSRARARVRRHCEKPGFNYVEGEHDGYTRLSRPVTHRRRIVAPGSYWAVLDEFEGPGEHDLEATYHYAPGFLPAPPLAGGDDREFRLDARAVDAGLELFSVGSSAILARLVRGGNNPDQGWCSQRYGHREAATVLSMRMTTTAPALLLTLLIPFDLPASPFRAEARRLEAGPGALACEIRSREWRDVLLFAPSAGEAALPDIRMAGEFLYLRTHAAGGEPRVFGTGIRQITCAGETLFDNREPAQVFLPGA